MNLVVERFLLKHFLLFLHQRSQRSDARGSQLSELPPHILASLASTLQCGAEHLYIGCSHVAVTGRTTTVKAKGFLKL